MKVVINRCFGGFGLSPIATLRLHNEGLIPGVPVAKWYDKDLDGLASGLRDWRAYLAGDRRRESFLTVFSPDETMVVYGRDIPRNDPRLIACVEDKGAAASGLHAKLAIVEIPNDVEWEIAEYDGSETVEEKHRSWR